MQKEILKMEIKKKYGKVALTGNNVDSCCSLQQELFSSDKNDISKEKQISSFIGYNETELKSIPEESILGLGCGTPLVFTDIKKGETVVDLGSGVGIDVLLASKLVGKEGKIIGVEMTDENA